jgi:pimeloyl-ACP methyl ester carboxylesterase
VLCFDHPTLQVGPIMNAVDLERVLGGSRATVDVLCHSRGGLVARWWAEALARDPQRVGKVVFVGSPLAGTSLAAPPKIRRSMELLSNVVNVLRAASGLAQQVAPLMIVVTGLLRVLSSMTRVAAKTPLTDATIAIVPGLVGMSRVGDNPEVLRLRRGAIPLAKYLAVVSDFEPEGVGWKFWRYFTNDPLYRVADLGADFVFGGANDLVVDTESMRDLADARANAGSVVPAGRTVEFGKNPNVHHLNYFAQPGTLEFLTRTFASRG